MTSEQELPHEPERIVAVGRGIELCVETIGDPSAEPLLLVSGLSQQMHAWPLELCRQLAARGLFVIRFDNRDVGRSTHLRDVKPPSPLQLATRRFSARQYALGAMALDTSGLLDALGLESAHVAGRSMGGMIGQTLAARQPDRVRSLTSIMSMTGARRSGRPALSTWRLMTTPPAKTREKSIEKAVVLWRHIGSHGFPFDEEQVRADAGLAFDRGHDPAGVARQLAAIMKSGDRTREVATIAAPTLVIHGDRDMMVAPSGGRATANAIPGARHETIRGMGHDLPVGAWPRLVELIAGHVEAASGAREDAASAAA
ncbi:alpha/beta fold hydrolase [Conexibacter arvalis]|uniref:Pimeloyl-ACP methyl ester carboxylesterase n=1 Tax=Conexibacter arvalis TaxID=912552 RepID=A0A840IIK7_9ACTN|nr:alpha/beta fold hydrolase [Conexibacter arvalis]MBB4664907.1 pimeloyl-ACP methyl ester carboxylesterase [Conexibacter arvalis]